MKTCIYKFNFVFLHNHLWTECCLSTVKHERNKTKTKKCPVAWCINRKMLYSMWWNERNIDYHYHYVLTKERAPLRVFWNDECSHTLPQTNDQQRAFNNRCTHNVHLSFFLKCTLRLFSPIRTNEWTFAVATGKWNITSECPMTTERENNHKYTGQMQRTYGDANS